MPSQPAQVVTFDDWSGGEYSTNEGIGAAANTFHGSNVLVYANKTIGPRPGLRDITPIDMPEGDLRMLATTPVGSRRGLMIVGDQCYYFDLYNPDTAPTAFGDPLNGDTDRPITYAQQGVHTYITVPGDRCYDLNVAAATVTELSVDSPGGSAIVIYGERLYVVGDDEDTTKRRQIYYSDPNDYTSWPAENFFNVGDEWQITGLRVQRQGLTIFKREGIFSLTGIPGINANLRPLSKAEGPLWQWHTLVDEDDMAYFLPAFRFNPALYDGSKPSQMGYYQEITPNLDEAPGVGLPVKTGVTYSRGFLDSSSVTIAQGADLNTMQIKHNGTWTRHQVETGISGVIASDGDKVIVSNGQAKIYSFNLGYNRPIFVDDNTAQPGDDSQGPVTAGFCTPEWWSEDGQDYTVRSVMVDFIKWDVGSGEQNHFDIRTEAIGTEDDTDGNKTSETYSFDEDPGLATSEGVRSRVIFRFGEDARLAPGFQLFVENLVGCHIRRIKVTLELEPELPRR
jgi:hypothetical protein